MTFNVPGPPQGTPDSPDQFTREALDFSAPHPVDKRVLHINTPFFRYGTDDKSHAAAISLSAVLLIAAVILGAFGTVTSMSGHDPKWLDTLITWIGNAFLFTAGIAVGQRGTNNHSE